LQKEKSVKPIKSSCGEEFATLQDENKELARLEAECFKKYTKCNHIVLANMRLNKEMREYIDMQEKRTIKDDIKAVGVGLFIGLVGGILIGGRK